jgi:uncharacterized protein
MYRLFIDEIKGIYSILVRNRAEIIILASACLFITLNRYQQIWNDWFSSLLYLGLLPVGIIFILRKNPLDFGLRIGNFKVWWLYVAVTCIIAFPILYFMSSDPAYRSYYHIQQYNLLFYSLTQVINLGASEFLFRGFLLFGLKDKFKELSIVIQMVPFVLVHLGKPELETISTIVTGILFGYFAYRGKSYWPVLIIHLFINIVFVALANI